MTALPRVARVSRHRQRAPRAHGGRVFHTGLATIAVPGVRADGLRVLVGSELESLAIVGTVPGVAPVAAAARCGTGTGTLFFSPGPPPTLQFQAPGSSTPGAAVAVGAGGYFLLEDGADASKWLRAQVSTAWLSGSSAESSVYLEDRFNALGPFDVPATEASAGGVDVFTLTLLNASGDLVRNVAAWLDPVTYGLAISTDGSTWKTPRSEGDPNVLTWSSIQPGASVPLSCKRTIPAGMSPQADILNVLQFAWDGL